MTNVKATVLSLWQMAVNTLASGSLEISTVWEHKLAKTVFLSRLNGTMVFKF